MKKTILITGSTDGIGLETAKKLLSQGNRVLIHGRNSGKLQAAKDVLLAQTSSEQIETYLADFSSMSSVESLALAIADKHHKIDVLINNAGVYQLPNPITEDGLDARFAVNTIAPYLLTKKLLPLLEPNARVINLSSAAQAPVDIHALQGKTRLNDAFSAYAQSKLALTMWSRTMALALKNEGPVIIAVNPGSLLATKMVREGFGMAGNDITVGSNLLSELAVDDEYSTTTGKYFDNDAGRFSDPHPDALDPLKSAKVVDAIEAILT